MTIGARSWPRRPSPPCVSRWPSAVDLQGRSTIMATETTYGRHVIRSMKISGDWNARAFRGKAAIGPVHSGATEEAAIGAAKAAIDADHAAQRAARGPAGVPTAAEEIGRAPSGERVGQDG